MNCLHGLGPLHWVVDLLMLVPLVGGVVLWVKMKVPKKLKLSESIITGDVIVSPKGERAVISAIHRHMGLCLLTTVSVRGDHFDLEVRSPTVFDELFKGWVVK